MAKKRNNEAGWLVTGPLRNEPEFQPGLAQAIHDGLRGKGYAMLTDYPRQELGGVALLPGWHTSKAARMLAHRALESELPIKMIELGHDADGKLLGFNVNAANLDVVRKVIEESGDANS